MYGVNLVCGERWQVKVREGESRREGISGVRGGKERVGVKGESGMR